jgi:hypothetical protein
MPPSPLYPRRWNYHPPEPVQASTAGLRPCGCWLDPVVFGHERRPYGCGGGSDD